MTLSEIREEARKFIASRGLSEKEKIIRYVYQKEKRLGLRYLADYIREMGKGMINAPKINSYYLYRLGRIGELKKKTRGSSKSPRKAQMDNMRKEVNAAFRYSTGSGGRVGKQGGLKNLQTQQFYQSCR